MFDCSKPKTGCLSSYTIRWTCLSPFDVPKNDVRIYSMNDLVNLVKGFLVRCSKSVRSKPKFRCSSSIINKSIRLSSFDVRKMMFEFI